MGIFLHNDSWTNTQPFPQASPHFTKEETGVPRASVTYRKSLEELEGKAGDITPSQMLVPPSPPPLSLLSAEQRHLAVFPRAERDGGEGPWGVGSCWQLIHSAK